RPSPAYRAHHSPASRVRSRRNCSARSALSTSRLPMKNDAVARRGREVKACPAAATPGLSIRLPSASRAGTAPLYGPPDPTSPAPRDGGRMGPSGEEPQPVGGHQQRAPLVARHGKRGGDADGEREDDEEEHPADAEVHVLPHHAAGALPEVDH